MVAAMARVRDVLASLRRQGAQRGFFRPAQDALLLQGAGLVRREIVAHRAEYNPHRRISAKLGKIVVPLAVASGARRYLSSDSWRSMGLWRRTWLPLLARKLGACALGIISPPLGRIDQRMVGEQKLPHLFLGIGSMIDIWMIPQRQPLESRFDSSGSGIGADA